MPLNWRASAAKRVHDIEVRKDLFIGGCRSHAQMGVLGFTSLGALRVDVPG